MKSKVLESATFHDWRGHLFGLSEDRWRSLEGKVFWVSGAGTGYGRAVATALAAAGSKVILCSRRMEKLEDTIRGVEELGVDPGGCMPISMDLKDESSIARAVALASERHEVFHGAVNNAALPPTLESPLLEGSGSLWDDVFDTNVRGHWLLSKLAFPRMLRGGSARILFITSMAGWASTAGAGMYNISKAALNSLGHSFAEECAAKNPGADIQVNVVAPGESATEMNKGSAVSPCAVVSIVLLLLSCPRGGPNGRFFNRDGSHMSFGLTAPHPNPLI